MLYRKCMEDFSDEIIIDDDLKEVKKRILKLSVEKTFQEKGTLHVQRQAVHYMQRHIFEG